MQETTKSLGMHCEELYHRKGVGVLSDIPFQHRLCGKSPNHAATVQNEQLGCKNTIKAFVSIATTSRFTNETCSTSCTHPSMSSAHLSTFSRLQSCARKRTPGYKGTQLSQCAHVGVCVGGPFVYTIAHRGQQKTLCNVRGGRSRLAKENGPHNRLRQMSSHSQTARPLEEGPRLDRRP